MGGEGVGVEGVEGGNKSLNGVPNVASVGEKAGIYQLN
jgi:hypothetical protein